MPLHLTGYRHHQYPTNTDWQSFLQRFPQLPMQFPIQLPDSYYTTCRPAKTREERWLDKVDLAIENSKKLQKRHFHSAQKRERIIKNASLIRRATDYLPKRIENCHGSFGRFFLEFLYTVINTESRKMQKGLDEIQYDMTPREQSKLLKHQVKILNGISRLFSALQRKQGTY